MLPWALSLIIFLSPREVDEVEKEDEAREERKCPLFRRRESLSIGKGIGYCDIASCSTTCEGDLSFCESPDFLKQYLRKR